MHISEGVLTAPILTTGVGLAALGVSIGIKKMEYSETPKVGILSATFFVASLIHVPIGPSSAHLILNGLLGIILGWAAFPAILIALLLQAIMFGFGGITVLGINTVNMALPAVICYHIFSPILKNSKTTAIILISGFLVGMLSISLSALLTSFSVYLANRDFESVCKMIFIANMPIAIVEGIITAMSVEFLHKVKPELLYNNFNGNLNLEISNAKS